MSIPKLVRVKAVTEADIAATEKDGLLHLFAVGLDAAAGIFGARVPFITISSRCALRLLACQESGSTPPVWAAELGTFLEWIDPGHLQAAMVADFARCVQTQRLLAGGA